MIALTLAAERPEARVQAVDRSPNALGLARENAARLGLAERVEFVEGDLLASSPGPFDLVAANLPYIPSEDIAGLAREVQHDPIMALDGGPGGLDLVDRCVRESAERLAPGGRIALEIGHDQAPAVRELLAATGFGGIEIACDFQGHERFAFAVKP